MVKRQHHDRGAQADAPRAARHMRRKHQRRATDRIIGEVMLREPGHVEADILGKVDQTAHVLDHARQPARVLAEGHQVEKAQFHRGSSIGICLG